MRIIKYFQNNIHHKTEIFGLENRVFPLSFMVLKLSGYWKPTTFRIPLNIFYNIYTIYCVINVILLLFTMILDNIVSEKSVHTSIENLFVIITIFNGITKLCNIYFRRSNIISILKIITDIPWINLQDNEETKIVKESIYSEKYITRLCIYLVIINIFSYVFKPIMQKNSNYDLVVDAYSFCDRSHALCFWISYVHQVSGYISTSLVQVGFDSVLCNCIERISSLLKILQHRLMKLPKFVEENIMECHDEFKYIKECIRNHHSICKAIDQLNDTFIETVSIQFVSSISTVCTNIYLLSLKDLFSAEFNAVFIFLCCVLFQNFLFCWYGYKISTNSSILSNSIFNMNWCILQKESKRMLTYVMLKTSRPIYLFSSSIVRLSPESFIKIIKLSYSAFNILQQTSKSK